MRDLLQLVINECRIYHYIIERLVVVQLRRIYLLATMWTRLQSQSSCTPWCKDLVLWYLLIISGDLSALIEMTSSYMQWHGFESHQWLGGCPLMCLLSSLSAILLSHSAIITYHFQLIIVYSRAMKILFRARVELLLQRRNSSSNSYYCNTKPHPISGISGQQ